MSKSEILFVAKVSLQNRNSEILLLAKTASSQKSTTKKHHLPHVFVHLRRLPRVFRQYKVEGGRYTVKDAQKEEKRI